VSFSTLDTIAAIATPAGRGGIGVVRVSGPDAVAVARVLTGRTTPFEVRRATLARVAGTDSAIVTVFEAPASYTGEDVVEISAHGSPVVLRAILVAAVAAGARLARPGEFTFRAFLNGRIDLPQAEAVADLVDAVTPLQARTASDQLDGTLTRAIASIDAQLFDLIAKLEASVDFPDEGYHFVQPEEIARALDDLLGRTGALLAQSRRGRLIREGLRVVIVGRPNVGKSSLFNALAGAARAIVTEVPGTTRDLVTEVVDVDGLRTTLVDTAGLRDARDRVEAEGVSRARGARAAADLVLVVVDRSQALEADDRAVLAETRQERRLVVVNKIDLPGAWPLESLGDRGECVAVSAVTSEGLEELRQRVCRALDAEGLEDPPAITNVRHIALVEQAREALTRARLAAGTPDGALSEEFVLADLQDAREALEEVTGRRTPDDVIAHIFERFCIGK
jgi:tRNA modification GTPase